MHTQPEQENRLNTEGSDRLAHTLFINCGRALAQAVDEQDLLQSVCNTLVNDEHGLHGLLIYWRALQDTNEILFYRLLLDHIESSPVSTAAL
jgi:hypothetical protein